MILCHDLISHVLLSPKSNWSPVTGSPCSFSIELFDLIIRDQCVCLPSSALHAFYQVPTIVISVELFQFSQTRAVCCWLVAMFAAELHKKRPPIKPCWIQAGWCCDATSKWDRSQGDARVVAVTGFILYSLSTSSYNCQLHITSNSKGLA